ncbi:HAD hydrolase-like protein [Pedomonas mirosovicensis]|uniref:HAD hydrolase-like protein n=1 Tax=Pedomonas mirosovicensis TaxID=2908641 RepID=UPI0021679FEC|nr:HAD hydrolase-like protein [Pedomonas mirosovicensis]MCH8684197.1 HAD hydrolase-like protein [Pedomonas mirosovicensis]
MTYRLVIFDFDGTLADSADWFIAALNKAALRFGFRTLSGEEVAMLRGRSNREIIRYLRVPMWKMPMIAAYIRRLSAEDAGSLRLFPGVGDALIRLRAAGIGIAIVSSNTEATIRRVLGAEIAALVETYECGASLFGKAAKFRRVLRRTGIPAEATISIGDEARDIEAAGQAGVAAGAVTWGYATPALLQSFGPAALFDSFPALAESLISGEPASAVPA